MTPQELLKHMLNALDGVEVDADAHDTNLAIIRAGMTIAGIGLAQLDDEDEREFQLRELEPNTRGYLFRLADRRAALQQTPYPTAKAANGQG